MESSIGTSHHVPLVFNLLCNFLVKVAVAAAAGNQGGRPPIFPAVFAFGDSILDTGNNNVLPTAFKSNFPPYGQDFAGHLPTGRFSNGKLPGDLTASKLGIKELLPAYLSPDLKEEDLLTGVSFASASSGFDALTAELASVLSLVDQLELFKEYQVRLQRLVGEERSASIIGGALYIVSSGSNDIVNNYFATPFRKSLFTFPEYADFLIQSASSFLHDLYDVGARRIALYGQSPLGCLPAERTLSGGVFRDCVWSYNEAALYLDRQLASMINQIYSNGDKNQSHLLSEDAAKIVKVDVYSTAIDIINNPQEYGFEVSTRGCCGTGELELGILCNNVTTEICSDDSKYVFWDSFHPTQRAYEIQVEQFLELDLKLLV